MDDQTAPRYPCWCGKQIDGRRTARETTPRGWDPAKTLGSLNGETRLIRNMFNGSALSLNISGPPSVGLHHRLCFPNETCQFSKFIPTYASSNRTRLTAENGVAGGTPGMLSTEAMNFRAPSA